MVNELQAFFLLNVRGGDRGGVGGKELPEDARHVQPGARLAAAEVALPRRPGDWSIHNPFIKKKRKKKELPNEFVRDR